MLGCARDLPRNSISSVRRRLVERFGGYCHLRRFGAVIAEKGSKVLCSMSISMKGDLRKNVCAPCEDHDIVGLEIDSLI